MATDMIDGLVIGIIEQCLAENTQCKAGEQTIFVNLEEFFPPMTSIIRASNIAATASLKKRPQWKTVRLSRQGY